MKEYIERAALLNEFCRDNCERQYDGTCHNCRMTDTIADFPAADVVEVRHGRWFFAEYEFFTCSVCGESYYNGAESTAQAESYLNSGHTYKYCPNCGAPMTDEAVQMVMERLEALHENRD